MSRMLWLATGIVVGIALWNAASRWLPRRAPANQTVLVNPADPLGVVKAMAAARSGDTIETPAGEFLGPVEFKDGVNLIAEKPGATVLRADPAAVNDAGIAIAARGVHRGHISGLRISGDEKFGLTTGLLIEDSAVEIDDTEIAGAADCGERMEGASEGVLRANFIHDNAGCGVWIGGESAPRLAGNRISGNGGDSRPGIEVHPPAAPSIENNLIRENGSAGFGPVPDASAETFRRANVVEQR